MQTRVTKRGVAFSDLGFGAAQLGNLYRETSESDANAAIDTAWDAGIRYFDTAPHYGLGLSERRVGAALRDRPRDEFVISTKVGRVLEPTPGNAHENDASMFRVPATHQRVWDFSRDGILRSVEESLERTGLDRLDVLYLHDPDSHFEQAATEGIQTLIALREEGVVGAVGAGMNDSVLLTKLIQRADVDVVMCAGRFTLLDFSAMTDLLPAAYEHGVGVVVAGVYNSGLLSRAQPPQDAKFDYEPAPVELVDRARRIASICVEHGVILPEAALAFAQRHTSVISTVVGMRTDAQVADTIARHSTLIPAELWSELARQGLIPEVFA